MSNRVLRFLFYPFAFLIGLIPGFFVVFNSIFSDVTSLSQRILTIATVTAVYATLGFFFGYIGPGTRWAWGIPLSLPAIMILLLYTFSEPENWLLHLFFAVLAAAASSMSANVAAGLKKQREALKKPV